MRLSIKIAAILGLALSLAVVSSTLLIIPLANQIAMGLFHQLAPDTLITILIKIVMLLTLVVVPLAYIIWFVIMRLVVLPLRTMREATKVTAGGNYGARVRFQSDDEIGELAVSLNQLFQHSAEAFQGMANAIRDIKKRERELATNISELQKAHQNLQDEKTKLQEAKSEDEAILAGIDNGVAAINLAGKIISFNWAASVITGYSDQEAKGAAYDQILNFYHEKNGIVILNIISEALKGTKQPAQYHSLVTRKDGTKLAVTPSASPFFGPNGAVLGAVVVFSDSTKERQLEKLKDEFVSIASHELRTPMTAIKGMLSMIAEGDYGPVNEDIKEPLTDIATSTDRLISLVNDLLNVSRIEAGRMTYDLTDFSLPPVMNEAVHLLKVLTDKKGIQLEAKEIVTQSAFGDLDKIKQVLNNLLGNAYKFTDRGTITISSKIEGELVKVYIRDSGIGITSADQAKLFAKFQQVSTQQNGRPAGTGLGLYLSRELMRKMGGDLWIEQSATGQGSVFAFSLPLTGTILASKVKADLTKEN